MLQMTLRGRRTGQAFGASKCQQGVLMEGVGLTSRPRPSDAYALPVGTAKAKVFVNHCRRRRKESLISWPAAQTWACSERAD
jgi:hypothetical protein